MVPGQVTYLRPDVQPYVDLVVFDRDPVALVARAVLDAESRIPGLVLRPGTTEAVLLEVVAQVVAEDVFALNRLPAAVAQVQARLAGVVRSEGVAPTATATFTVADVAGYAIPAGTRLVLYVAGEPLIWTTDVELVIPPGLAAGVVAITCASRLAGVNGTPAGTVLALLDAVYAVEAAALADPVTGGADPEGAAEWLARAGLRFSRLSEVLTLPRHFEAAALEDVRVSRALALDAYDPSLAGLPGSHLGAVSVAVSGVGGVALSPAIKNEIRDSLDLLARADLLVSVIDTTTTAVAVTVTVRRTAAVTDGEVVAAVAAALEGYLSPDTWAWGASVYRNELLALIDGVAGVDRVEVLTLPAADVVLAGVAPLADLGATVVTVVAP